LGFRLNAWNLAFFALLLLLIGVAFRQILVSIQQGQAREALEGEWGALRGRLEILGGVAVWTYDADDPEGAYLVGHLRQVLLVADLKGRVLEISPLYQQIGPDSPADIQAVARSRALVWRIHRTPHGDAYLARAGLFADPDGRQYYVSIGRALNADEAVINRFTWTYFSLVPLILLLRSVVSVYLTKRALRPLIDVARATELITGENLSHRVQLRGAGDELDRLTENFNRMVERLEDSFQQMRQFTTNVSHELRTPITAIRGQLEVALMTSTSEEQLREAMLTALEATERLSRFVNAMLQLAQAESGQLAPRKERLDLCAMAREVLEQMRIPAEEARVRLLAELPERCLAAVDRTQFERLLCNLLENGIKYTPENGEVRLSLRHNETEVSIVVEDTGRGMPAGHLPHIFERFYRIPNMDSIDQRGLGLGLSFVAWIVKVHAGRIEVASTEGQGSRFAVTLPLAAGQPAGLR
jgi:heavy metal sensor kinase